MTRILEEVANRPGMTFGELTRALDAPKSSVHGFMRGLVAAGWLQQQDRCFYLGPAVYGLTLAGGRIPAGLVTHSDLDGLRRATGLAVFLGVLAGDDLIYISNAGSDPVAGVHSRPNIRRVPLATAGGKALVAARSDSERDAYLRRRSSQEPDLVHTFLEEYAEIRRTQIATNLRQSGERYALATTVDTPSGEAVASVTLVGRTADVRPRQEVLSQVLIDHVKSPTSGGQSWGTPTTTA
jgi:DNA-binding IclR family transcriptional regulator